MRSKAERRKSNWHRKSKRTTWDGNSSPTSTPVSTTSYRKRNKDLRNLSVRNVPAEDDHRDPENDRTHCDELGKSRSVLARSYNLQRLKSARAVEQEQVCSGNHDGQHLDLEHHVDDVKPRHAHEEEKAGNDVQDESPDSPRDETLQRSHGQLLQESKDSEIQSQDRTQQQDQAEKMQVFQYRPHPHRIVDNHILKSRNDSLAECSDNR